MIPLRNETAGKGLPFVTTALIAVCCAVFTVQLRSLHAAGLVPVDFMYAVFHPWPDFHKAAAALVTAFFMHGSLFHLLSNMWYLWLFGAPVERQLGTRSFIFSYIICGILSMLIQVASSPLSNIPILGASGAIAGIMGLSLIFFPFSKILVYIPPVFLIRFPAFIFLLLWFFIQYLNIRWGTPKNIQGGVAWYAHIGGYLSGALIAVFFMIKGLKARVHRRQVMSSSK